MVTRLSTDWTPLTLVSTYTSFIDVTKLMNVFLTKPGCHCSAAAAGPKPQLTQLFNKHLQDSLNKALQ